VGRVVGLGGRGGRWDQHCIAPALVQPQQVPPTLALHGPGGDLGDLEVPVGVPMGPPALCPRKPVCLACSAVEARRL
jgi:hypothetical protein